MHGEVEVDSTIGGTLLGCMTGFCSCIVNLMFVYLSLLFGIVYF